MRLTSATFCLLSSLAITRLDRRLFPRDLLLYSPLHTPKASLANQHEGHRQLSQSRCISIYSASRTGGRSQLCDKLQQSSDLVCGRKPLPSDLQLVCATSGCSGKNGRNPGPTKAQSLECGVCCVVTIFPVCQEFERSRKALAYASIPAFASPQLLLITSV